MGIKKRISIEKQQRWKRRKKRMKLASVAKKQEKPVAESTKKDES